MTDTLLPLFVAALILFGSPGPVPIALFGCGASFGAAQSRLFLAGLLLALGLVIVFASLGLGLLLARYPALLLSLSLLASAYLCFVAIKIARLRPGTEAKATTDTACPGLVTGLMVNLTNPKAYAGVLALQAHFTGLLPQTPYMAITQGVTVFIAATVVDVLWLLLGAWLGRHWLARCGPVLPLSLGGLLLLSVLGGLALQWA